MSFTKAVLFVSVMLFAFAAGGVLLRRSSPQSVDLYRQAQTFEQVVARVATLYVDSLSPGDLYDLAIDGMLEQLGDPYSDFLRADELEQFSLNTTGNYAGVGLRVESTGGWITVVTALSGTPADSAGIATGDRVVAVDGRSIQGWTTDRTVSLLRGEAGTAVLLNVARPGVPAILTFALHRGEIHVAAVTHTQMLDDGVGYVDLETVSESSSAELRAGIETLRAAGATSLVLDLRSNPGGLLTEGIAISDMFLAPGDVVVETRDRTMRPGPSGGGRRYEATEAARWSDMPMVILVDEYSASAAEIISGALQDHDRALVMGAPTFGKGLVQSVFPFSGDQVLKLTTGRWYTPTGRSIQRGERSPETADPSGIGLGVEASEYESFGGRPLRGGGGIYPDLVIPSGISDGERALARFLGEGVQSLNDVLSAYALELAEADIAAGDDVTVTAEMRAQLRRWLRNAGVTVPNDVWDAAGDALDAQLGQRLMRFAVGREAEMRLRTRTDPLVIRAARLLVEADSVAGVFVVAAREAERPAPLGPGDRF